MLGVATLIITRKEKKDYKPLLQSISVGRLLPHIYTETAVYSLPVRLQGLRLPLRLEDIMN